MHACVGLSTSDLPETGLSVARSSEASAPTRSAFEMSGREPTVGFAQSKPLAASDEVARFLSDLSIACSAGDDVTLEIRHERSGKVLSAGVVISDNASVPLTVKQGFDLLELEPLFVGPDLRILSKEATFSNLLADGLAEDEQGRRAASTPPSTSGADAWRA